jgi:sugar phosphate isomerase/epimerase
MTRREFIGAATVGAATLMAGPTTMLAAYKKLPIGVQLWSVRAEFAKDVPVTLAGIKKLGFDGVEFAGYANYSMDAAGLRKLLDDTGLKACGSHVQGGLQAVSGDRLEPTIEFNKTIGNDKLIVASMSAKTVDDWQRRADQFNAIAEKLKPHKMRIGYHNHTGEFAKIDGQTPEDIFFGKASHDVFMQLDIGHCFHGGGDPAAYLKKYGDRILSVHAKDWSPSTDIIGEGDVKWDQVLTACAGAKALQWYIVEEESGKFAGLDGIAKDYKNLSKLLHG